MKVEVGRASDEDKENSQSHCKAPHISYEYSLLQWKYLAFYCVNRALMVDDMLIVHFSFTIYLKNHLHLHFMTVQTELHFKESGKPQVDLMRPAF